MTKLKIIISGGGTGGHIFPAISIANELRNMMPDCEILFVGALGRMEMERVPAAGYRIVGLPVMGFPRKPGIKTLQFFFKLAESLRSAHRLIKQFKPNVVVGVGGYASGPVLRVATKRKIPAVIQEQNSYAGITNRLLAAKVDKVCVAYEGMERFFPVGKIVYTGNPVRRDLHEALSDKAGACSHFGIDPQRRVLLVVGGSLGARTLNNCMLDALPVLAQNDVEVIWQTGSFYYQKVMEQTASMKLPNVHIHQFLSRMDLAYAAADLVISRAGAGTISELCLVKKPTILVPSPNVAEDHQTRNALALAERNAAVLISDHEATDRLIKEALQLIEQPEDLQQLSQNIAELAKPNAAKDIAQIVIDSSKRK